MRRLEIGTVGRVGGWGLRAIVGGVGVEGEDLLGNVRALLLTVLFLLRLRWAGVVVQFLRIVHLEV